jgi:O-antigen/teichoic acid export membrane protein
VTDPTETGVKPTEQTYHLGRTIAKNAAFVTLGRLALKAVNFLFSVYVIRHLGDNRYGQYSIILAFVAIFQILAELGISQYVMREIARDRSKAQDYFWNLVTVRLGLAGVGILIINGAARLVGYSPELLLGIFIYTLTFLLAAFEAPMESLLTANERLDIVAVLGIIGQVAFVILGGIFMLSGFSFIWLIVASLLSFIPQILLAIRSVQKNRLLSHPIHIQPRLWPRMIRSGIPFGIIQLTLTVSFGIDTVILSRYRPENVVGWYNVAYNLVFSLLFFFTGFSTAIVPSLARTYAGDAAAVERWYYRSIKYIFLIGIPVATGGMLVAYPLIRFLYTQQFLPAAAALQIIIWDIPVLMFASFCGNMTTVVGEEHNAAKIYTAAAAFNVLANLIVIPRFGYIGAAATTVLTDLLSSILFYLLLHRKLHLPDVSGMFLRVIAASALMGGSVYLARGQNIFVVVALGALIYALLVFGFRMIDQSEWGIILRLFRRRGSATAE